MLFVRRSSHEQKYIVRLTEEERSRLTDLISKGKTAAPKIKHANILLKEGGSTPMEQTGTMCRRQTCFLVHREPYSLFANGLWNKGLKRRWRVRSGNIRLSSRC